MPKLELFINFQCNMRFGSSMSVLLSLSAVNSYVCPCRIPTVYHVRLVRIREFEVPEKRGGTSEAFSVLVLHYLSPCLTREGDREY